MTFTATVSGSTPTGSVNFRDGTTSISGCSAAALSGSGNIRTATCATSSLAAGTHSISAVYGGDANDNGSTSATLSESVSGSTSDDDHGACELGQPVHCGCERDLHGHGHRKLADR